jgi:light-regulated signal transduction histidine kinase (bacteriophytochrome)
MDDSYKDKYEELKKEYADFAYIISHDLQSPARQLHHFTKILLDELKDHIQDSQQAYIEMIDYSSNEINSKLSSLLELALLNDYNTIFESVNLGDLLKDVLKDISDTYNIEFSNLEISSLETVSVDRDLLFNTLSRLLLELYKVLIKSDVVKITCKKEDADYTILLLICNNTSLTDEQLENIFLPFFDLKSGYTSQEHNIGLVMCKKALEINKGELRIFSEDNNLIIEMQLLKSNK